MKANEVRKLNAEELTKKLDELKKNLFMVRMQHATNQLDNPLKIQEVKKYILDNKGATVTEVAQQCDVQSTWIQKWLREARLELTEGSAITLNCESCGARIRSGRLCKDCANKFNNAMGIGGLGKQESIGIQSHGSKMRFLKD